MSALACGTSDDFTPNSIEEAGTSDAGMVETPLADAAGVDAGPDEDASVPIPETPAAWKPFDAAAAARLASDGLVGLAVGVAHQGKVVFVKGYGFEDREAQIPVDFKATRFRWASVSKSATGVLLAQLATENAINLDANIPSYYPGYVVPQTSLEGNNPDIVLAPEKRVITPRQLAGHLGGIAHYTNGQGTPQPPIAFLADPSKNTGMESALVYLAGKPLVYTPGNVYSYSSFGFNLLGVVLEKVTKLSFAELIETRINKRAGTQIALDREATPLPRRAVGYFREGAVVKRQGSTDVSWKAAGGGLISTPEDLTQYCAALSDQRLLSAKAKTLAWTTQKTASGKATNYGFGFRVGSGFVTHDGAQEKSRTLLKLYTASGLCLVIMSNSEYSDVDAIAAALDPLALAAVK